MLKNEYTGKCYIGSTNNLERRLKEHKSGLTRTSRILGTYTLVYVEKFDRIDKARTREKQLKSYKSRKYIEWLISNRKGP